MWDSANEVSRILEVWRCAGMRLRWEAAVGGRRVAWREADCSREPPHAGGLFFVVPGQKGATFPDFFAFGSLPPKPAHIEQNVFEAWCWEWLFPQNRLVVDRNRRYARIRLRLRSDFLGALSKSPGRKSPRVSQSIQGRIQAHISALFVPGWVDLNGLDSPFSELG